jgi:hypothetical protein
MYVAFHHLLQTWLINGENALFEAFNFLLDNINAGHVVAQIGKTGACYQANISRANYTYH